MQLCVYIEFDKLKIPRNYNHILQAVLLRWLNDENYSRFLHDIGYKHEKRTYKLFSFSSLYGDFLSLKETNELIYSNSARFIISCVEDRFMEYLVENFIKQDNLIILNQKVCVARIEVWDDPVSDNLVVRTVSPVTMYSTFENENGKKFTKYYSPDDVRMEEKLVENMYRKYIAFYKQQPKGNITIKHVGVSAKKAVIKYKGTIIEGWKTDFLLTGEPELIKFALNCGLGSKNSQGFGCIVSKDRWKFLS
ncbi:MAG: CRISPR-associated endoribonuclease Cas6 [Fervidobacterium sp.]|nr:CRISPR-associated endoribonuclease Cas6 [Fervidobacterium sp.]